MNKLRSRLLRHLSFANVLAAIALFVALGGVGYAATTINGNKIIKQSIGAGKLKKGTLTSTQVKADGLNGSVIDESTLKIVPAAQTAVSAQTATSATTATSAETAKTADTAKNASSADSAGTAKSATNAVVAEDAETLDGFTPEELQVSCPEDTTLYGGMCWDDQPRGAIFWIPAAIECGEDGGRLPTLSELVAYIAQPGVVVDDPYWSADVIDLPGGKEHVLTREEGTTDSEISDSISLGFRCVFLQGNFN